MDKTLYLCLSALCLLFCVFRVHKPEVKKLAKKPGFFGYTLLYTDQKTAHRKSGVQYHTLLKSDQYHIQGKPDYVYKKGRQLTPVEIKSGQIKDSQFPHEGDWMQVLLYFLLLEDVYGIRPQKGFLLYKDGAFAIYNTKAGRRRIQGRLKDMRRMLETGSAQAEAGCSFIKCKHCICKHTVCEYYEGD